MHRTIPTFLLCAHKLSIWETSECSYKGVRRVKCVLVTARACGKVYLSSSVLAFSVSAWVFETNSTHFSSTVSDCGGWVMLRRPCVFRPSCFSSAPSAPGKKKKKKKKQRKKEIVCVSSSNKLPRSEKIKSETYTDVQQAAVGTARLRFILLPVVASCYSRWRPLLWSHRLAGRSSKCESMWPLNFSLMPSIRAQVSVFCQELSGGKTSFKWNVYFSGY